ncbi:hypothetical protein [Brevundimonas sp.]|uniref:hypothetical protein n=1 Tax=Brevundimonas sp. TaxID=1871086 RepID=UPI0028999E15|nr:hypothetical protein [Brevundimonas sp.]
MVAPVLLAAGVSSVGKLFGGFGAKRAGQARARMLTNQARNVRQEAGIKASLALEDSDRTGARAATLAAASGGGGLQGSALDVIGDLARQGVYRARQVVRDGLAESAGLLNDATTTKRQGSLDLFSSMIDATSTFLGGVGQEANARRGADQAVPGWMSRIGF